MKCFFASVECAERGLNPFETNLVVADESRGTNALCLAISPKMKTLGCKNRCRMSEIPKSIQYIVAKPRMKKYIEYAADIYDIGLTVTRRLRGYGFPFDGKAVFGYTVFGNEVMSYGSFGVEYKRCTLMGKPIGKRSRDGKLVFGQSDRFYGVAI